MRNFIFGIFIVCLPAISLADIADETASLYERIRSYESLSAKFDQRITDRDGVLIQESEGEFSLAKPNKVHWRTLPPYEQEIIGDGEVLWVYDADLEQATKYSSGELLKGPMALFSEDLEAIRTRFKVDLEKQVGGDTEIERYTLDPTQSAASEGFSALVFEFHDSTLSKIEIHDRMRQLTSISLKDSEVNKKFSADKFIFSPPQGIDILDND